MRIALRRRTPARPLPLAAAVLLACCLMSASLAALEEPPAPAAEAAAAAPASDEAKPSAPAAAPQFLAVLRLVPRLHEQAAWKLADNEAVGRHFARLQEGAAAGTVIFAGRTQEPLDVTMGLIVFEAADAAAARAWAEADPAVVAGVMTVEVHPYALAAARH